MPEWIRVWRGCKAATKRAFKTFGSRNPRFMDFLNTYWLENRRNFRVLEKLDRCVKRLDLNVSASSKRKGDGVCHESKKRRTETRKGLNPTSISVSRKRNGDDLNSSRAKRVHLEPFNCCTKKSILFLYTLFHLRDPVLNRKNLYKSCKYIKFIVLFL